MGTHYSLISLTVCDDEFHDVVKLCGLPFNEDDAEPLIIEKIVNPSLEKAFDERVADIARRTGGEVPKIRYPMYHGTSAEAAEKIAKHGFDASKSRVAAFNKGTYFAQNYEYSTGGYAKIDAYGHQFMFVCKVIEGRRTKGTHNGITNTAIFDSAGDASGSIISTPFNDGALPMYFMRYYKRIPNPSRGRP
jgi:hypothetical protein